MGGWSERPFRGLGIALLLALAASEALSGCASPTAFGPSAGRVLRTPEGRIPTIGYLTPGLSSIPSPTKDAFIEGLRELGYREGETIQIESRFTEGNEERVGALAQDLVDREVDVIVIVGTPRAQAARGATSKIPIVMLTVSDPVEAGLVESLRRPGGNVTGMSTISGALAAKRLELLKETVPQAVRVAVFSTPSWAVPTASAARQWRESQAAAEALGLELELLEVRHDPDVPTTERSFDRAFEEASRRGADAGIVLGDALFDLYPSYVADLAARHGLPFLHTRAEYAETKGGLLAFGPNVWAQAKRGAVFVDRILKGANPAELPVEQPTTFDFVVNLKAAEALGITVPTTVMIQATKVIQ